MATWHDTESALLFWKGVPRDAAVLEELLEIAKTQVLVYGWDAEVGAPYDSSEPDECPTSARFAQLRQARNIWNASKVGSDGQEGNDSFAWTPFPLDWSIKQLLRPARTIGFVG